MSIRSSQPMTVNTNVVNGIATQMGANANSFEYCSTWSSYQSRWGHCKFWHGFEYKASRLQQQFD